MGLLLNFKSPNDVAIITNAVRRYYTEKAESLLNSVSGALLTAYALGLAWGALFLPNGALTYVSIIQSLNLGTFTIFILKLVLGAPFCFHYFNAMRYIAWNAGKFLDIKSVYDTSYKSMVAAAALTVFFALI